MALDVNNNKNAVSMESIRHGRGGSSYHFIPDATTMVGILPVICFRRCSYFLHLFIDFHSFEHIKSIYIYFTFKIPPLEVGLLGPSIQDGTKKILLRYTLSIFLLSFYPGTNYSKLLSSVHSVGNVLKGTAQGILTVRHIARFCSDIALGG